MRATGADLRGEVSIGAGQLAEAFRGPSTLRGAPLKHQAKNTYRGDADPRYAVALTLAQKARPALEISSGVATGIDADDDLADLKPAHAERTEGAGVVRRLCRLFGFRWRSLLHSRQYRLPR